MTRPMTVAEYVASDSADWPEGVTVLADGLHTQTTPNLPRGYVIRCAYCGCSVPADHNPGGADCLLLQDEREWKYRS